MTELDRERALVQRRWDEYMEVVRNDGKNAARRWVAYEAYQKEVEKLGELEKAG